MKRVFYLIIFISSAVFSQNNTANLIQLPIYPSFQEVAFKFFNTYSLPETEFGKHYSFAKKPNGWHVLLVDVMTDKVLEDDLFWERPTNTYKKLSFEIQKEKKPIIIPEEYDNWDNNYFNSISPYHGYRGWDTDVIKEYGLMQNLSDSVLNALARAYVGYSRNLLENYLGLSNPNVITIKQRNLNSLSAEQLENYRKYEHLGIETYKKLWKLNPKFETFVGDAYTVYSNQVMNCFLTLRYYQNEEEAQKELKQGLYDPFFKCIAKNYLASCDSNAIIFTNGDNDTYPLLYVQEQEGYRKDVLVVNISLLGSSQYMNHLFNKIGFSDPLSVYINKDLYTNGSLPYVYIIKKITDDKPIELKELMAFISSSDTLTKYKYEGKYLTYIPTTQLKVTVNKNNAIENKIVAITDTNKIESTMEWYLNRKTALYQNEIAILDIIACADFKRSIYFAVTVADESYLNLKKYFQLEGLAYKIVPVKYDTYTDYQYGSVNTTVLYNKLKDKFCNVNWETNAFYISDNHKRMGSSYRNQYSRLATALINENKLDSAREMLSLCFSSFPIQLFPVNYSGIAHIQCYYQLNDIEKANELSIALINECSNDLLKHKKDKLPLSKTDDYSIRLALRVLDELNNVVSQYNQIKLKETIKSTIDTYTRYYNM